MWSTSLDVKTNVKLNTFDNANIEPLGEFVTNVTNPKNGEMFNVKFIVVPNNYCNLLGRNTIVDMGFINVCSNII